VSDAIGYIAAPKCDIEPASVHGTALAIDGEYVGLKTTKEFSLGTSIPQDSLPSRF
jgi:hypothetical protein